MIDLSCFKRFPRRENWVYMRLNLEINAIEVTPTFANALEKALQTKIALAAAGIDELDPITKFALMVLENA